MTRSVWKGPFVDGYLLKKAEAVQNAGRKDVKKAIVTLADGQSIDVTTGL